MNRMFRAALRAALVPLCLVAGMIVPGAALAAPSPSFNFSPNPPLTLQPVTFTSTSTGVVPPQTWDLDGDGACDDASGVSVQRTFEAAGEYTVKLCVTDGTDAATLTRKVTVLNRSPLASLTYSPASPLVGDSVVLTSTSVDLDGPIAAQAWDLDADGAYDDGGGETASLSSGWRGHTSCACWWSTAMEPSASPRPPSPSPGTRC